MKVKSGYLLKKVMGSYMIISENDFSSTSSLQTLNETGAFLWSLMENDTTVPLMAQAMTKEYDIDIETALKDTEAFVAKLEKAELIEK